jgi:hypothetical protein
MKVRPLDTHFLENFEGAALSLSAVEDHGEIRVQGYLEHRTKDSLLTVPKGLWHPVAVEADLPDGDRLVCVVGDPFSDFFSAVSIGRTGVFDSGCMHLRQDCVDGIEAEGWPDHGVLLGKLSDRSIVGKIEAVADHTGEPRRPSSFEDAANVLTEPRMRQVCMNIEETHRSWHRVYRWLSAVLHQARTVPDSSAQSPDSSAHCTSGWVGECRARIVLGYRVGIGS